jgi:UDP-glucose-4-epimerase GalE
MRILVTGGAGYIGSTTARQLAAQGHAVMAFDDLRNGHPGALDGLPLTVGDVRDVDLVTRILREEGIDAVIHFAAIKSVAESVADPGAYFDNNVGGTVSVLRAMAAVGVGRFVFSSSCAVYGPPDALPVTEVAPLHPANAYGESKLLSERMLPWFAATHGLRFAVLRYFNAAGAALDGTGGEDWSDAANLIPIVLQVAAGRRASVTINGTDLPTPDGTAIRDYVHVEDLAAAHLRALDVLADRDDPITVNVGTGRGVSVLEVIEAARRITGHAIPAEAGPPRVGDPPAMWADTRLAADVLGWRATHDLDAIVGSAWRWHVSHPDGHAVTAIPT